MTDLDRLQELALKGRLSAEELELAVAMVSRGMGIPREIKDRIAEEDFYGKFRP